MTLAGVLLLAVLAACQPQGGDTGATTDIPKPEHPRPDWQRAHWHNLNGRWAFDHDPDDLGLDEGWYRDPSVLGQGITVPFPFEAPASGLGELFPEDGTAGHDITDPTYQGVSWYHRLVERPHWEGERVFLVFGAVDWRATVWVNGQELGSHEGGWLPFELDATDALRPGLNSVVVRVEDLSEDEPDILNGKQGGGWYTRSSGIWQTVYLEGRPEAWIAGAWFHPDWESGEVQLQLEVEGTQDGSLELEIVDPRGGTTTLELPVEDSQRFELTELFPEHDGPALWSPAEPSLYEVTLRLGDDEVSTYFGVRGLGLDWAPGHGPDDGVPSEEQFQVFTLNGEPIYLRGVLDQNYHPEGLLTYPDEDALVADLELARDLGFNLVRVHIMHPEPRKLWHADRMGLLVMQDIPTPNAWLENVAGTPYRDHWAADLEAAWRRDHNHPSLVSWVLFNEAWGLLDPGDICTNDELQSWVLDSLELARTLDHGRWIEDDSTTDVVTGVFDHLDPDFTSWHFYSDDWDEIDAHLEEVLTGSAIGGEHLYCDGWSHQGQPLLLSEFAGAGCYETVGLTGAEIATHFTGWVNAVRRHPRIAGYVFTQLTDVEWERNGLVAYDRSPKELGMLHEDSLALANAGDAIVLSGHPGQSLAEGETVEVQLQLARGGDGSALDTDSVWLSWFWALDDGALDEGDLLAEGELRIDAGWGLHDATTLVLEGPGAEAVLAVVATDGDEQIARTERRYGVD